MNLTLIGSTGKVGRELMNQALDAGHAVTVLVRNPDKLDTLRSRVTVVQGDVTDVSAVDRAVTFAEAVLSTLGHTRGSASDLLTVASSNVVKVMRQRDVRRLVVLTNTAISDPGDQPTSGQKIMGTVMGLAIGRVNRDHIAQAQVIAESELDWTIVRAVMLSNGPHSGKYKVGKLDSSAGSHIARADVADFMLATLTTTTYLRSMAVISQ